MSRQGATDLAEPFLFSANDRVVDPSAAKSVPSILRDNYPYLASLQQRGGSGSDLHPDSDPSEILYSHTHLLEKPAVKSVVAPLEPRVGIIQSFQIEPAAHETRANVQTLHLSTVFPSSLQKNAVLATGSVVQGDAETLQNPPHPGQGDPRTLQNPPNPAHGDPRTLQNPPNPAHGDLGTLQNDTASIGTHSRSETPQHNGSDSLQTCSTSEPSHSRSCSPTLPNQTAGLVPEDVKLSTDVGDGDATAAEKATSMLEDIETSSMLSIDQLTETLRDMTPKLNLLPQPNRNNPKNKARVLPPGEPSSQAATSSQGGRSLLPILPLSVHHQVAMPAHVQAAKSISTSHTPSPVSSRNFHTFCHGTGSEASVNDGKGVRSRDDGGGGLSAMSGTSPKPEMDLQEQLLAALRTKAHLEGQLESVVEECRIMLQERAELQSRVARAEAAVRGVEQKSGPHQPKTRLVEGAEATLREQLQQATVALQKESHLVASVQVELEKEKAERQRVSSELTHCKRRLTSQEAALKTAQEQCATLTSSLDQRNKEKSTLEAKVFNMEAALKSHEESKHWLRTQLDNALELNSKVQEELRDSKMSGLALNVRAEQLHNENADLQRQITNLHRGMFKDKERLVGQLEAIEADILSREEMCKQLAISRVQMEDMLKAKREEIDTLAATLAQSELQRSELGEELAEARGEVQQITQHSQKEKNLLNAKVKAVEEYLIELTSKGKEMEKQVAALQEKQRQAETALIMKDGLINGLQETCSSLRRELEAVEEGKEAAEEKLDVAGRVNEEIETALRAALEKEKVKENQVRGLMERQESNAAELWALKSALLEKDKELSQRCAELITVEAQSKDIATSFQSLQERFHSITDERDVVRENIAEKDKAIGELTTENSRLEEQLALLKEDKSKLQSKMEQLLQEKAHLQEELEAIRSADFEELRNTVQAKASLEAELNVVRLTHQQEVAKTSKKISKLEAEIKALRDTALSRERDHEQAMQDKQQEVALTSATQTRLSEDLQNAREELMDALQAKKESAQGLKLVEERLAALQTINADLMKTNSELSMQLEREATQRSEIERASSLVTVKLKQNAEEREKKLQDQIGELLLETERLRGRLSGINAAQLCMRNHTGALEAALASKESSLAQLSAQAQKALEEKKDEESVQATTIALLEQSVVTLKDELQKMKERAAFDRKLSNDAEKKNSQLMAELKEQHGEELATLHVRLEQLGRERDDLKGEVKELQVQTITARTAADMVKHDLANKNSQVEILHREVEANKLQLKQAYDELNHLKEIEARRMKDLELAKPRYTAQSILSPSSVVVPLDSSYHSTDAQEEEVDGVYHNTDTNQSLTIGNGRKIENLPIDRYQTTFKGTDHWTQEHEHTTELNRVGEAKGDMGQRSKGDINKLQKQMEQHSTAFAASYRSSRQIESQIENLKRSSHTQPFVRSPSQEKQNRPT